MNQDFKDERMDHDLGMNQDGWDERMDQDLGMNQDGWDERMDHDLGMNRTCRLKGVKFGRGVSHTPA